MNLPQLEAFAETCIQGSYTRAANRLYISQPALHHRVKQLEAELGMPLLVVHNRRVIPTREGQRVLEMALRVIGEIRGTEEYFKSTVQERSVRVGTVSLFAAGPLFEAVAAFRREDPRVDVLVKSIEIEDLTDALEGGAIDLAITYRDALTADLHVEPFLQIEIVPLAAPGHPLTDGAVHEPGELLNFPLSLTEHGMRLRTAMESWFAAMCDVSELPIGFESRNSAQIAQAAASAPYLITFLPRTVAAQFNLVPILVSVPIRPWHSVICYLPAQRRGPVTAFLQTLRAMAAQDDNGVAQPAAAMP